MRYCGQCKNFTGAKDWNLSCMNPPESSKYSFSFLCYEDTEADECENFKLRKENK